MTVSKTKPKSVVKISQDDRQKTFHKKDYTSNIIGWILRGGVILSASIILIGLLLLLVQVGEHPGNAMNVGAFPHSLSQVLSGLKIWQPQAIITTGLLLLIAIPIITVTTSLITFTIEHNWRFVIITGVVLAILLASIFLGKGG